MKNYIVVSNKTLVGKNGKSFKIGDLVSENDFFPGVLEILISTKRVSENIDCKALEIYKPKKFLIFIFSYNRKEMLESLISELETKNCDVMVIDDGSDFIVKHANKIVFPHQGKLFHWKRWNAAFQVAKEIQHKYFGFLPDDFSNVNLDFVFPTNPCVLNVVNDGRLQNWNKIQPIDFGGFYKVGFTDCGFFCQRESIERIEFYVSKTLLQNKREFASSGVGLQLTNRFNRIGIPIFTPKKSLAFHGDHESKMHPKLRKIEPLISK
jgi:hypothetical protein